MASRIYWRWVKFVRRSKLYDSMWFNTGITWHADSNEVRWRGKPKAEHSILVKGWQDPVGSGLVSIPSYCSHGQDYTVWTRTRQVPKLRGLNKSDIRFCGCRWHKNFGAGERGTSNQAGLPTLLKKSEVIMGLVGDWINKTGISRESKISALVNLFSFSAFNWCIFCFLFIR